MAVGSLPLSHGCLRRQGHCGLGGGGKLGSRRDCVAITTVTESCLPSMAPFSHHWQKAQSCYFQQESGCYLCHQSSVPLGMALPVLPAQLPRDMWKLEHLWSWGHRLPCWKVPKEGRQHHTSAQIPSDSSLIASPMHRWWVGYTFHPGFQASACPPCHHLQEQILPVTQAGSLEAQSRA